MSVAAFRGVVSDLGRDPNVSSSFRQNMSCQTSKPPNLQSSNLEDIVEDNDVGGLGSRGFSAVEKSRGSGSQKRSPKHTTFGRFLQNRSVISRVCASISKLYSTNTHWMSPTCQNDLAIPSQKLSSSDATVKRPIRPPTSKVATSRVHHIKYNDRSRIQETDVNLRVD